MKIIIVLFTLIIFNNSLKSTESSKKEYLENFSKTSWNAFQIYNIDKALYLSLDLLKNENSDSIKKISNYRFCLQDSLNNYNVIYGYPENGKFIWLFNYKCDSSYTFTVDKYKKDTNITSLLYKLVNQKEYIIEKYAKKNVDLTYYTFVNSDSINLFILPSWQNSQLAVYGPEFCYTYNSTGEQIDSLTIDKEPLGFSIKNDSESEIYLDLRDKDFVSLGSVFFTLLYKEFFKEVYIETKNEKSYLIDIKDFRWGHIHK